MKKFTRSLAPLLALLLVVSACATLAPGADPVVVRTEQTLKISLSIWDSGLDWLRANPAVLTPGVRDVAEKVRTVFPPAYKATDDTLTLYKAGKASASELMMKLDVVQDLVSQIEAIVAAAKGPPLRANAAAKVGGAQ